MWIRWRIRLRKMCRSQCFLMKEPRRSRWMQLENWSGSARRFPRLNLSPVMKPGRRWSRNTSVMTLRQQTVSRMITRWQTHLTTVCTWTTLRNSLSWLPTSRHWIMYERLISLSRLPRLLVPLTVLFPMYLWLWSWSCCWSLFSWSVIPFPLVLQFVRTRSELWNILVLPIVLYVHRSFWRVWSWDWSVREFHWSFCISVTIMW